MNVNSVTKDMLSEQSFSFLAKGSKIIVPTEEVKNQLNSLYIYDNVEVISVEKNQNYAVPCTSLKFNNGTNRDSISLKANTTDGTPLSSRFSMLPLATTDTIKWTSTNENIATVEDNNYIETKDKFGTCEIVGKCTNGQELRLEVTVTTSFTEKNTYLTEGFGIANETHIMVNNKNDFELVFPSNCEYLYNSIEWKVADKSVLEIDGNYNGKRNVTVKAKKSGKTDLVATFKLGDTTYTRKVTIMVIDDLKNCTIDTIPTQAYTGKEIKPQLTIRYGNKVLKQNVDYVANYYCNIEVGTAEIELEGIGDYFRGSRTVYFNIKKNTPKPNPVSQSISVANTINKTYGNGAFHLGAKAKTGLSYKSSNNNIARVDSNGKVTITGTGTCTITITAKASANYKSATKKVTINVAPKRLSGLKVAKYTNNMIKLQWAKDNHATGYRVYRYDSKKKNYVLIKTLNGNKNTSFTDSKKSSGTVYSYRVVAVKGNLTGQSADITAYTKPNTVKLSSVKAKKNNVTISWKKDNSVTGYEIVSSTSKNGKYKKVAQIKKNKTTSFTQKKVKSKKTHYYKVRAYKVMKVNGKNVTVYGDYSVIKSVKVK